MIARLRPLLIGATVLAALPLAMAQDEEPVPAEAFAVVGSELVLRKDVTADVKVGTAGQALDRLVYASLLRQNLLREGADLEAVTEADVDAEMKTIRGQANPAAVKRMLEQSGQTEAQFRRTLRLLVATKRLLEQRISEDDLKARFEDGGALALTGELRLSHLVVHVTPKRDEQAAKRRANALLKRLQDSDDVPDAFAKLAMAESDDPLAPLTAGDLDWHSSRSMRAPSRLGLLTRAAFGHGKEGLLPQPVRSPRGFHVLLVTAVRIPESATFESLRERLLEQEVLRRSAKLVEGWMAETPIRYAPDAPKPPGGKR